MDLPDTLQRAVQSSYIEAFRLIPGMNPLLFSSSHESKLIPVALATFLAIVSGILILFT
jgi:hypothetical protein